MLDSRRDREGGMGGGPSEVPAKGPDDKGGFDPDEIPF
jgi:hypothetical protein